MALTNIVHGRSGAAILAAIIACCSANAPAQNAVTLAWDANTEADLGGYKIYYGTSRGTYPFIVDAGNVTTQTVTNLQESVTYYFSATAYNTAGLESDFSTEISHTITVPARAATTATLASSQNPAAPGQTVVFTFTVRAVEASTNTPTGSVLFRIGESASAGTLSAGTAIHPISSLPAGTHIVTVEYAGDMNFLGVTNRLSPDQVVNTVPIARTDQINRILPNSVKVQVPNLLTNDTDADGHALTLSSVSPQSANGATVTRRSSWIYYVAPEAVTNADSFTYTASDGLGASVTGTVNVRIVDPQPSPNVTVSEDGGSYRIRFDGTPGVTYRMDFSEAVDPPAWQLLGTRTADEFGIFEIVDTPPAGTPARSYRSIALN
jgi:hypothetical protein